MDEAEVHGSEWMGPSTFTASWTIKNDRKKWRVEGAEEEVQVQ